MGETDRHRALKLLAVHLLRSWGCAAAATEVRSPIARFRVDAAGVQDRGPPEDGALGSPPTLREPRTIVVECKQARGDFLADAREAERLLAMQRNLERKRVWLEERLRREEPGLRQGGTSLFEECEEWDYLAARDPAYREVMRGLRRLDRQLYGETKFGVMARYRLADRLVLATPAGLLKRTDLPWGWGLVEAPVELLDAVESGEVPRDLSAITLREPATDLASQEAFRARWLRSIAVSASRQAYPAPPPDSDASAADDPPQPLLER